jgi:hypothetical protein
MNISEPFIRRPIATALAMSGLAMVGLVAYLLLPVAPLPQVEFPTIQVTAQLPGTSPETMASSVASPLERQLAQMSGVAQLTSVSGIGISVISIRFDLARNIDAAGQDVKMWSTERPSIVARSRSQPLRNQIRASWGCRKCQYIWGFETRRKFSMRMLEVSVITEDTSSPPTKRTNCEVAPRCDPS